jgi:hypothetical protein
LGEESHKTEVPEKTYSKEENKVEGDELDTKVTEYMKENNVDYGEAYDAIVYEEE